MSLASAPAVFRHGPLTVYLKDLKGEAELSRLPPQLASPVMWLDSARQHPTTGRWSTLGFNPWMTLIAREGQVTWQTSAETTVDHANPLDALRKVLLHYRAPASATPHGRAIGLMGALSYELNRWIERLPDPKTGFSVPDFMLFAMRQVVLVDHQEKRTWLISVADPHVASPIARREANAGLEQMEAMLAGVESPAELLDQQARALFDGALRATTTQSEFEAMVARALGHIRAGDIFQANLSQRFTAPWTGDCWGLYLALRQINPSPFACWLSCDEMTVVSGSPERLVRVQQDRIDTRPIAGTRPRGATFSEDELNSLELLLSDKERAEHIMLVDLARNDLGRVCRAGSVWVNELMSLERYSHVIHIVSDVAGLLRQGVDAVDVIRAVFPGGTITGCPKVRCMEILHELEPVARGLYTGSLGMIGFDGTLDLNIAIRTLVVQKELLSFHVGAGIVADSEPAREYAETLDKAAALMQAIGETVSSCKPGIGHGLG